MAKIIGSFGYGLTGGTLTAVYHSQWLAAAGLAIAVLLTAAAYNSYRRTHG